MIEWAGSLKLRPIRNGICVNQRSFADHYCNDCPVEVFPQEAASAKNIVLLQDMKGLVLGALRSQ